MSEAANESGGKLVAALAAARAEMPELLFDKVNPHFKNSYASLAAHIKCATPSLSKHGLVVTQTTEIADALLIVVTTLEHVSGEKRMGRWPAGPANARPQDMGSAATYSRRYSYAAILMLAGEDDDDGEAARKGGAASEAGKGAASAAGQPSSEGSAPRAPRKQASAKPVKTFAEMTPPEQVYSLSRAAGLTSKEAVAKFCGSILGREMVATKDGQQVPSIGSVTADEAKVLCKELRAIAVQPSEGRAA